LIGKDISEELLAEGMSTMNKDNEGSMDVTSITTVFNGTSMRFDLYRPFLSSVVDASSVIEYKTHPIHTVCTGDLVFLATMFGKDGMSHYWCPYCQMTKNNWSKEQPSKIAVEANLWTDELMEEKRLEYNAAKEQNSKVNGILGVNNKKLWPYSVNDIIPPVLHIPLGLIQNLWDNTEKYITTVSNVSDVERASRSRLLFLTEQDVTLKGKQITLAQRLKDISSQLKLSQKEHDNIPLSTPEYFQSIEHMNALARLKVDVCKHQETDKKLKDMSAEEMKKEKKVIDEYESNRTFFEDTCHQSTKDVLASYRIYRQAYMSRCFIGPHARKMMMNAEDIMHKIECNLKENCHATVDHTEIKDKCDSIKRILLVLNSISSYTKRTAQLSDEDLRVLELKVRELSILWRKHGMSVTPKFHILECHIVDAMKKHRVLGLFSEEAIERTHHEANVLQGLANSNDFVASQQFIETRRLMGQSAEVITNKSDVQDNRKRRFGVMSSEKKRVKVEVKAELKREAYSMPVIDFDLDVEF